MITGMNLCAKLSIVSNGKLYQDHSFIYLVIYILALSYTNALNGTKNSDTYTHTHSHMHTLTHTVTLRHNHTHTQSHTHTPAPIPTTSL